MPNAVVDEEFGAAGMGISTAACADMTAPAATHPRKTLRNEDIEKTPHGLQEVR